jgi:Uma2 family endonuclease
VLQDVSWETYEALLKQVEEEHFQLTYDDGRLEIMSPLPEHEWAKQLIGAMIMLIALERNIPMRQLGQTTYRRRKIRKGLEPDQCYYVQNEKKIRGRNDLDFNVDPVPDLVLKIDVTSRSIERMPIYAALRVPEVWRHDEQQLACFHLSAKGKYEPAEMSLAFPFLRVTDLNRFLEMRAKTEEMALLRSFRDWVRAGE